jgi:hypothetical protein
MNVINNIKQIQLCPRTPKGIGAPQHSCVEQG